MNTAVLAAYSKDSNFIAPHSSSSKEDGQHQAHALTLTLDDIRTYHDNPRKQKNTMFDELKSSIRERGLDVMLQVTKRPEDSCYIIESGGNTRLNVLQELWQETGDEQFYRIEVMYRPWVSELHVLTAHLSENIMRSDMCFYDRACAIHQIKAHIEHDEGCNLKWSEFERRLEALGLKHSHGQVARMRFLREILEPCMPQSILSQIGPHHVQRLQSGFKEFSAIDDGFPESYREHIQEAFEEYGCNIDAVLSCLSEHFPTENLESQHPEEVSSESTQSTEKVQSEQNQDEPSHHEEDPYRSEEGMGAISHSEPAEDSRPDEEYNEEDEDERKKRKHIEYLQRVIELRSKLYHHAHTLLGDDVWVTDNAFGFGVNIGEEHRLVQDLIGQMSAYALGSESPAIDVEKIYNVTGEEFHVFLKILSLSKEIIDLTETLKSDGIIEDNIDDLTNSMIIDIQNELDPTIQAEKEMIQQYIQHGATNTLLFTLFPILSPQEVVQLREDLDIENNGGRPIKALPFEKESIHRLCKMNQALDERELYLLIAEETELPLSTIWNTVKALEFVH